MKIVLANNCLGRSKGGIEAWIYHAAETLLELGHEPILVANKNRIGENAAPKGVKIIGIKPFKHLIPLFGILEAHFNFRTAFKKLDRELKPDAWWIRSGEMAGAIVKNVNSPIVFIHAANFPEYARMSMDGHLKGSLLQDLFSKSRRWPYLKMAYFIERRALKYSYANVYLSNSRRQEIANYYGDWMLKQSHVIPPGVDFKRFHPTKLKYNDNELRILSVCRLVKDKNIQQIIKAIALLAKKGINIHYRIAGDGGYAKNLQTLVKSLNIENNVEFIGESKSIEEVYRWGDIFVLLSIYEGFGNVYLEAMASGLPCLALRPKAGKYLIATDEIIEDDYTGRLLENDSPESCAMVLEQLSINRDHLKKMKKNARTCAIEKYSWKRCITTLLKLTEN